MVILILVWIIMTVYYSLGLLKIDRMIHYSLSYGCVSLCFNKEVKALCFLGFVNWLLIERMCFA